MGEEESDVDIEGFEEDDDGKPKTPAPVINLRTKPFKPGFFHRGFSVPFLSMLLILWSGYKLLMRLCPSQCQIFAGNYEASLRKKASLSKKTKQKNVYL